MEIKAGIKTTEFWLTAIVNVAGAVIALLAARGLMTGEEGELWLDLVEAIAVAVIPIALAIVNYAYISSRKELKNSVVQIEGIHLQTEYNRNGPSA